MEVDPASLQPAQCFTQPPPAIVVNPQQPQQQRGQTSSKTPYDKN